jgi:hypothetical protein
MEDDGRKRGMCRLSGDKPCAAIEKTIEERSTEVKGKENKRGKLK